MASNSDSIFHLLSFLKRHPDKLKLLNTDYDNVVRIAVSSDVPIADTDIYFPKDKLMVNRLSDDFVSQHGELLNFYMKMISIQEHGFLEAWVTTAYLSRSKVYFLELSFE
ncbi:hypothetical protein [Liquorilactobacillus oeni]|uniref:Uncharacterized protein n=1 Tax=Liquorilactobacillus oeni DSM 19972 TaxID=1423777 RepID=A0A0R1M7T0_9LACO|nr:hypothetical protein [Liquorilactobacillus oeni]KRL04150.1 hypothetical protein FD46_GL001267 [Liquorilactobacillus oeni DSM 19972]